MEEHVRVLLLKKAFNELKDCLWNTTQLIVYKGYTIIIIIINDNNNNNDNNNIKGNNNNNNNN